MPIGDELLNLPTITPAAPAVVPPAMSPGQLIASLQGYRDAFSGMTGDPALNPAMIRFGLNLLQPIRPGDSPGGVLARSATDAMDYYTARQNQERNQLLAAATLGQRERELGVHERTGAETVATSQQNRSIQGAKAPVELGQAQQAYRKAQADLDLIAAEEKAGTRSPDFLSRKAKAEVDLREALAAMYRAHSDFYSKAGAAQGAKNNTKQTLNVQKIENPDGTTSLVSTVVVNGEPYFHSFTPARFADMRSATDFATREVEKVTPSSWNPFAGPVPYQGTKEEEIARRVKAYMTPSHQILGPKGVLTQQQYEALDNGGAPKAGPMPPAFPRESQQQASEATERSLGIIRTELRDARKKGDQAAITALEKEEQNAVAQMKRGFPNHAPATPAPSANTAFVRDAQGNIVRSGAQPQPAPAPQPVAATQPAAPAPSEQAGQALEAARMALNRARQALMSYGVKQQRADPTGYRAALMAVSQKQEEVTAAQQEYEKLVAPGLPAARSPLVSP